MSSSGSFVGGSTIIVKRAVKFYSLLVVTSLPPVMEKLRSADLADVLHLQLELDGFDDRLGHHLAEFRCRIVLFVENREFGSAFLCKEMLGLIPVVLVLDGDHGDAARIHDGLGEEVYDFRFPQRMIGGLQLTASFDLARGVIDTDDVGLIVCTS